MFINQLFGFVPCTIPQGFLLSTFDFSPLALRASGNAVSPLMLENVVYFELLRRGGEVYAGRTDAGEVDFVVMRHNGEREYYQVAYTANDENTLNRELSSLRKIKDTHPKYLLTTDFESANIDGIRKINVVDWLMGSLLN